MWKKRFAADEAPLRNKVILRVVVAIFFFFACEKLPFLRLIRKTLVLREIFVRCVQTKQQHKRTRGAHTYIYIHIYLYPQYTHV